MGVQAACGIGPDGAAQSRSCAPARAGQRSATPSHGFCLAPSHQLGFLRSWPLAPPPMTLIVEGGMGLVQGVH